MKKVYVSVPMRGRKEEDIKKSYETGKRIAEAVWGEKLELIETFVKSDPPATNNIAIYMLGESIKKMAAADYFIGPESFYTSCEGLEVFKGCVIENKIARMYDIESFALDLYLLCPDLKEKE